MVQLLKTIALLETILYSNMTLSSHSQNLASSLAKAGLEYGGIPLIPAGFRPTTELVIKYGEKAVSLGNFLKTEETKEAPSISFAGEASASEYLLLLVDPDAPTPEEPKFAYWRHWILTGLQPSDSGNVTLSKAPVTNYLGPGAKDVTASPHRYLFLLFREPAGLSLEKSDVGGEEFVDRRSFKADEFVKKNELELVGVNWFSGVGDDWKA